MHKAVFRKKNGKIHAKRTAGHSRRRLITPKTLGSRQKPKVQNINFDVELFNLTKDYVKDFMDSMTGSKVLNFPELIAYHIYLPKYRLNVHEFSYHDFFDKDKLSIHKRYNLNEEDYVYIRKFSQNSY